MNPFRRPFQRLIELRKELKLLRQEIQEAEEKHLVLLDQIAEAEDKQEQLWGATRQYLMSPVVEGLKCSSVFGEKDPVLLLAQTWDGQKDYFAVVLAYLLHNFAMTQQFTPESYNAYRQAITDVKDFLGACEEEAKELKKPQKKSSTEY